MLTIIITSHNYNILWVITHLIALECGRIACKFTRTKFYFETNQREDRISKAKGKRDGKMKINVEDVGPECVYLIQLDQDRGRQLAVVDAIMNLRVR